MKKLKSRITQEEFLTATGINTDSLIYVKYFNINQLKNAFQVLVIRNERIIDITEYLAAYLGFRLNKLGLILTNNTDSQVIYTLGQRLGYKEQMWPHQPSCEGWAQFHLRRI